MDHHDTSATVNMDAFKSAHDRAFGALTLAIEYIGDHNGSTPSIVNLVIRELEQAAFGALTQAIEYVAGDDDGAPSIVSRRCCDDVRCTGPYPVIQKLEQARRALNELVRALIVIGAEPGAGVERN
jgi:hypothetical protein